MSTWLRRARTSGAALVAVLVVLCQAAAGIHAAATPHVTCVEHGESVHLAAGAAEAPAGDVPAAGAPAAAALAHDHDHCGVQGQGQTSAPQPERSCTPASLAPARRGPPDAPPPVLALLRLAPKTSPPRAPAL